MAVAAITDEIARLVDRARRVPLTDQVRLRRADVVDAVERLREEADATANAAVVAAARRLADLVRDAKAIPLTDEVRVERGEILGALDEVRAAAA